MKRSQFGKYRIWITSAFLAVLVLVWTATFASGAVGATLGWPSDSPYAQMNGSAYVHWPEYYNDSPGDWMTKCWIDDGGGLIPLIAASDADSSEVRDSARFDIAVASVGSDVVIEVKLRAQAEGIARASGPPGLDPEYEGSWSTFVWGGAVFRFGGTEPTVTGGRSFLASRMAPELGDDLHKFDYADSEWVDSADPTRGKLFTRPDNSNQFVEYVLTSEGICFTSHPQVNVGFRARDVRISPTNSSDKSYIYVWNKTTGQIAQQADFSEARWVCP